MDALWPWLAVAGVGALHGLNPATGWLFAAACGVRSRSRKRALCALIPIAAAHVLALSAGHGADPMLGATLLSLCVAGDASLVSLSGPLLLATAAVALHLAAMLAVSGVVAVGACRGYDAFVSLMSTAFRQFSKFMQPRL
jgi:hypothetical protein